MYSKLAKLRNQGFTLIELIITIVIIGVLAAVAIPKFQSLNKDAEAGVAAGVGAALASATSVNYARSRVPGAASAPTAGFTWYPISTCANIDTNKTNLTDIPAGYVVTGAAALDGVNIGTAQPCTLTSPNGAVVTFNAYGAS